MDIRLYDEETGQVYTETQVPVTSMVPTWPYKHIGLKQDPAKYTHRGRGSLSLFDMAMRACAWHIDSFLPSHLQAADWYYSQKIYQHLLKEKNLSLKAWSIFQQAFPSEKGLDHNHTISVPSARGSNPIELPFIQKWLVTIPFSHVVALDIRGLCLRFEHLMLLAGIQNLGTLFMRHPQGEFPQDLDDKSMRDWCRVVQEKKAFTRLKVVGLHHFAPSWEASLKCLAGFPALRICAVEPFKSVPILWPHERIEQLSLPFEVISEDGPAQGPGAIWSRENISVHTKIQLLYKLANNPLPPSPESAFLSMRYGQECSSVRKTSPVWLKRVEAKVPTSSTPRPGKHAQDGSDGPANSGGGVKKRRIRKGKQSDIMTMLGGFG